MPLLPPTSRALLTYQLNSRSELELMGTLSQTRFHLIPQSSQLTSSIFSPYYTANLGLDIYFQGQEKTNTSRICWGFPLTQEVSKNLRLNGWPPGFEDKEQAIL